MAYQLKELVTPTTTSEPLRKKVPIGYQPRKVFTLEQESWDGEEEEEEEEKKGAMAVVVEPGETAFYPPQRRQRPPPSTPIQQQQREVAVMEKVIEVNNSSTMIRIVINIVTLLFCISLLVPLAVNITMRGHSLLDATNDVFFHSRYHSTTKCRGGGAYPAYPLWVEQHDTKSEPLTVAHAMSRPLISTLEHSFLTHMETGTQFSCLCMHHIKVPHVVDNKQLQVCGIYNRPQKQLYMLINPVLVGKSNQTDSYSESSVACQPGSRQSTSRSRAVFLQWIDPADGGAMYARFSGIEAVCMQLAMDEMSGNKHC